MESISLWAQRNQNEFQFYQLYPESWKCELAVDDIYEDLKENVNIKWIGFIQIQVWDRGFFIN